MNGSYRFVDAAPVVSFRAVDPTSAEDVARIHGWMHQPHVEPFWSMAWAPADIRAYLLAQHDDDHLDPWVVAVDGTELAYVETYRAHDDGLAEVFPTRPGDHGWHVLVGPPDAIGSGLPRLVARAVLRRAFADPATTRVLCEPDIRNTRMIAFCRRLGFLEVGRVRLSDKHAAVLACTRSSFATRFPHDLVNGASPRVATVRTGPVG